MITQVKSFQQTMAFASNFERDPSSDSGVLFGHFGGVCTNSGGTLTTIAAGTVSIPTGTATVYLNLQPATPVLAAEVSISSTRYVPLYQVTSDGTSLSNVTDLRSHVMASQITT